MLLKRCLLIFILLGLPACATVTPTPHEKHSIGQSPKYVEGIEHIVKKGETLWRISKIYRIDLDSILAANRISDSTIITPGEKLKIPKAEPKKQTVKTNFSPKDAGPSKENTDFIWPAKGKIATQFRQKRDEVSSKGIDILTEPETNVLACQNGKVAFVGELAGYGNTIIIEHAEGISTVYCGHSFVNVKCGDEVSQGTVVAKTGYGPRRENPSLHFEIRKKHKPQNPLYYLD